MKYCFGVDIGGTTVKMGLLEEGGRIVEKWEITTDTSEEGRAILPNVAASIEKKMEEHNLDKSDVIGIGAGVPAPVTAEGVVNGSANLGWNYKEVKKELEELTGMKACIGNDANVAALGEMWKGGGEGEKNIFAYEGTEILVQRNKEVQMAVNEFGKGRTVYISGLPYSFENSRVLYRSIIWASHDEENLHKWFSTNFNVEVHAYVKNGKYCVVNNTYEPQSTTVYKGDGTSFDLDLDANEIIWYEI